MELQELARRTALPLRRLRYVVDHDLVPGLNYRLASDEAGRPRQLAQDAAFGVACVAALLQGGMKRTEATSFIAALLDFPYRTKKGESWPGHHILSRFLTAGGDGHVRLGDGVNLWLELTIHDHLLDTGWRERRTGAALAKGYAPRLVIDLDVGWLRQGIFPSAEDGT